jgi:hypothetical protein
MISFESDDPGCKCCNNVMLVRRATETKTEKTYLYCRLKTH